MPGETIADYDVRSPASRTLLTVIGTLVAVGLFGGAVLGVSILMKDTKSSTRIIELGDSAQIVVNATTADIRVVEGADDVVKVTSRVTSGLRKTDFLIGRKGDEIKVISGCTTWLSPGCGVSLTLAVPKGIPVVINTTSGDVTADALEQGVLTVATASGDINVGGLTVDEFSAESSSGDVDVSFAKQPFGVKAITKSGDISASIPSGERTYAVTTNSKSGDVESTIEPDADGQGFVFATSISGDIELRTG
jgi:hypothetical protein